MSEPLHILQQHFGLPSFRPGQEAAIEKLLAGESVLTVFPTGGGKSLCYQLPALMMDGLTVVVSPLIALMQDQVSALQARDIAAARLDSSRSGDEVREIYRQLRRNELKILYIAPERLQNERFLSVLRDLRISLLAVDEAHCISEWGHNFRPDYLKLAKLGRELAVERVLALTATATPSVAADICRQFAIPEGNHIQTGFYRPNLQLAVSPCGAAQRLGLLTERLQAEPGAPGIVYVTLQQTAEEVAEHLSQRGIKARAYHAGMQSEVRESVQEAFMAGAVDVVVATIAFGMGIDKADIRAVYHYNLPKSLENYMQEIGRAGRDRRPSRCELFACRDDLRVLANFSYGDTPVTEHLNAMVEHLLAQGERFDVGIYELAGQFDIRPLVINTAITYLELEGVLQATGPFYSLYQVQFLEEPESICGRFDPRRADFLQRLFARGKPGRTWLSIDVHHAAIAMNEPRERLVKALQYLEEQGLIATQVKGVRQGYRRLREPELPGLCNKLGELFARREQQDIERLQKVLRYAEDPRCLPAQLCSYFGEQLAEPCGQCSSCRDAQPRVVPVSAEPEIGPDQQRRIRALVDEGYEALRHPRQIARFLCGLNSPATGRGRLRRHDAYGALADYPFRRVLEAVEGLAP